MQTEIAETLNKMQEEYKANVENFELVLSNITTKLEAMEEDNEAVELVRFYIAELKKVVEDKFSATMIKYDTFETSLDGIISTQSQLAKTSELKDLFSVLNAHNEALMGEISGQKSLIEGLSDKVAKVDDKSIDKEELTSLINDVSFDLSVLGENIQKSFTQIEENLKNLDVTEQLTGMNETVGELKSIVSALPDYSQEFENLEKRLKNIVTETEFAGFRGDLADFVQKIIDNSAVLNTELATNAEKIIDALNNLNYSDLQEDLAGMKECLKSLREVSYKASFDELSSAIAQISSDVTSLRASVGADVQENYGAIKSELDELVSNLQVLKDDLDASIEGLKENSNDNYDALKNYVEEITSNLGLLVDSLSILKTDVVVNKEKLNEITDILNNSKPIDYTEKLEQITSNLTDLADRSDILSGSLEEKFENIKELVLSLDNSSTVKHQFENFERAFQQIVTADDFLHLKSELAEFIQKIVDNSTVLYENSNALKDQLSENVEKINEILANLSTDVEHLKNLSDNKSAEIVDNVNACVNLAVEKLNSTSELNFGDLKKSVEKVIAEIVDAKADLAQKNDADAYNISSGFDNINVSLGNLLSEINSLHETEESMSAVDEKISRLNDVLSALTSDLALKQEEIVNCINDASATRQADTKTILENVDELKSNISDSVDALKSNLNELEATISSVQESGNEKLTQKLVDLEASLAQSTSEYEQKMELLQSKITEFAHIVENSNSDTEGKIASSLEEISSIKSELLSLNDALKSSQVANDEKFGNTISVIETNLDNVITNIADMSENIKDGVNSTFKENVSAIEEKFDGLFEVLNEVKSQHTLSNVDLIQDIEDKVTALKDELGLVNSDIAGALECKAEEIIRNLDPIKTGFEEFVGFDYEKILGDLKSQIEMSFMNFSVDINTEFASNSQAITKLEQAYKETFNKLSAVEECVNEKIQNNIELLKITLETAVKDIKSNFGDKFEDNFDELKDHFDVALNNLNVEGSIRNLKDDFGSKLEDFDSKIDVFGDKISGFDNKFEDFGGKISDIDTKIQNLNFDDCFEKLHDKFTDNFDNLSSTEAKVSGMIDALHQKVDAIASDSSDLDILDEIDNIKDIIFEQRKFFEVSSDEKANAIDKYLKDVLLKLDSVDLEKNSEDIKESILNVLVSLFDQISFVEETEEIKDFVEEKTDEINQHLVEVRNQLKQLTSPGDDFDYVYTLQDVESDIAKLRLAITNMSGSDFSDITDEMKKIADAVDGLENSLTQEQTVDLKSDIEKLNEDIVSISSRTNKLILNSDESNKALQDGLNNFGNVIQKLEDRISYLDNTEINERIERKIDDVHSLVTEADSVNKVSRQVMMYLGEWIDSASENLSAITEKTAEIDGIKESIQELKEIVPEKTTILDDIERKFEQQEERIDRLEMGLDKILSMLEEKDDTILERKVDKIEKMLSALGTNIEKLTSYVDEE